MLTTPEGKLDITRMSALVDQIVWLRRQGWDVAVVSSGAVACGRKEMQVDHTLDTVQQRQLFSAMGQVKLVNLYYDLFREYGYHIGQVLTTKDNFASEHLYQNQKNCMEVMLQNGVIPVVNENDTVSIEELMFTDNDELSGKIAAMVGARRLVLLSNVDGVFTGNPTDSNSQLIPRVLPGDDFSQYIQASKSKAGRGGMTSKYATARSMTALGIEVIIANGKRDNVLQLLMSNPTEIPHTIFEAKS